MLRKCLKYDLRDMLRYWWIGAVTLLALSIPAALGVTAFARSMASPETAGPWDSLGIMPVIAFYLAAIAFVILTVIFIFRRYYRNFFTDEGYQTFTLPVERSTLLLSKVLSAMVMLLLSALAIFVAAVVVMGLSHGEEGNYLKVAMAEVLSFLQEGVENCGGIHWLILCIAELVIMVALGLAQLTLFVYLCITFGAVIAKKHKLLATFGLMYGINVVRSIAQSILEALFFVWYYSIEELAPHMLTVPNVGPFSILVLGLGCVVMGLMTVLLWLMTLGTLERKLNLA